MWLELRQIDCLNCPEVGNHKTDSSLFERAAILYSEDPSELNGGHMAGKRPLLLIRNQLKTSQLQCTEKI